MKLVSNSAGVASLRRLLPVGMTLVVGFMAATAFGQGQYEELPLYKPDGKREVANWSDLGTAVRDETNAIRGMLSGGSIDNAAFDKYFNDILFPMFTREAIYTHPSAPPAKIRQRFKNDIIGRATNPVARERLLDLTLKKMTQIANGNFHPWARAEAAIMVEELNESEPGPPLRKAFPVLFKWATDVEMVDVVRVPALRGVVRHVSTQGAVDPSQRQAVAKAMLEIVKRHTATPSQSLEAHEWIMRRAIDVLAALGEPGDNGAVYKELVAVVEDDEAPRPARADAAAALSKIRFTPPQGFDAESLAKSLGKLAVTANKAEMAEAAAKRGLIAPRRIKQQLNSVRTGLVGADGKSGVGAMLTAEPQKKFVTDLVSQIDAVIKACDTEHEYPPNPMTASADPNYVPGVPFDVQKNLKKALTDAGGALEAVVQAGVGGNAAPPAGVPGVPGVPGAPPGAGATRPASAGPPMGVPGVPPPG